MKFKLRKEDVMNGEPGYGGCCAFALRLADLGVKNIMVGTCSGELNQFAVTANKERSLFLTPTRTAAVAMAEFDRAHYLNDKQKYFEQWKDVEFELTERIPE